jgi:hypothetical protein
MRILALCILFFAVIISSCNNKEELPKDILSQEDLINVIAEMEMTQALIKLKFNTKDTIINQKAIFEDVFIEMNTTEEQFNKSLNYYSQQPKILLEIYEEVIIKLSKQQAENQ